MTTRNPNDPSNDPSDPRASLQNELLDRLEKNPAASRVTSAPAWRNIYFIRRLVISVCAVFSVMLLALFAPLRAWESALCISFFVLPAAILIAYMLRPAKPRLIDDTQNADDPWKAGRKTAPPATPFFDALGYFVIGLALVEIVNVKFDTSSSRTETQVITGHKIGGRKHSARIEIPPVTASPLPQFMQTAMPFLVTDHESFVVGKRMYNRLVVNQSAVVLQVHEGFFGLPWAEGRRTYLNLQEQGAAPAPNSNPNAAERADIAAACAWRDNFVVTREIENIPPDSIARENWPNGAKKSEEPMVKGAIHGTGHYWFDNGTAYGDIPYKHGAKHGNFKLYREDGTLEQHLNYKDGQLYGINEWYKPDGTQLEAWVYTRNGSHLPLSVCKN